MVGEARAGHPFGGDGFAGSGGADFDGGCVAGGRGCGGSCGANGGGEGGGSGDGVVVADIGGTTTRSVPDGAGENVRRAGEDIPLDAVVLRAGTELGPAELGVAASVGRAELRCARKPRVAVLVTGDELTEPGAALAPGRIYSSNALRPRRPGGAGRRRGGCPGERFRMSRRALGAALADALDRPTSWSSRAASRSARTTTSSRRSRDLGVEERFWGVRLRPGKPTWFGARGSTLAFGLPGNPVSAMVTFQLFVRPALAALQGAAPDARRVGGDAREPDPPQPPARAGDPGPPRSEHERANRGADEGRPGLARAHLDGRRRRPRADRRGRGRGARRRARGGRAPVRPRDPRRLLERHRRARARVTIIHEPQSHGAEEGGATGSRQVAEVTLPREELEKLWSPEHLESLARTYWSFLSRFSLGLIRVLYSEDSREVVFLRAALRPAALPQARVRGQPRRRHGHVADRPRRAGREARPRARVPPAERATQAGRGRRQRGDHRRLLRGRELLPGDRRPASAAGSTSRPSCGST